MHSRDRSKEDNKARPRLGWDFKVVFLSVMLLLGLFSHAFNGWGDACAAAMAGLIVPIYGFREFWNRGQFWIAVVLLATIQVPLVIVVRSWIERGGFISMLSLGIADGLFVTVVIFFVCSRSGGEDN